MPDCDVIVIGSGPAGAHAAQTLVEHGANVVVLDGGAMPPAGLEATPDIPFSEVRKKDPHQFRWFLGDDLSGIPVSGLTGGLGGGQVSGNRSYVVAHAEALLPLELRNCQVIQSLAKGGLGASWGAACAIPDADELLAMRLNATELEQHFDAVMRRIGVSGNGSHPALQPALTPDHHAAAALRAYEARRAGLPVRQQVQTETEPGYETEADTHRSEQ
jgi:choline dehydrogenase-like flavoprotein